MPQLFLMRHLKSQWNEENRFTGWIDTPLDEAEAGKAKELASKVFQRNIDKIYSSPLFRNQDTVSRMFEHGNKKYPIFVHLDGRAMKKWGNYADISQDDVPIYLTEAFNERYYGALQGLNKEEAAKKFGQEKVHLWRRSYNIAPPGGESLKDVFKRAVPFYKKHIENDLKAGRNVLIVASHNPLRALVKYIEKISDNDIINVEIPYGGLIIYEYASDGTIKKRA